MVSKELQMKYGIWNNMKEEGLDVYQIAQYTGFEVSEVVEFFER